MELIIKKIMVVTLLTSALFSSITVAGSSILTSGSLIVVSDILAHPRVTGDCISCHPVERPGPAK